MNDNVNAYLLAGGKSSRMKHDKLFIEINGETLLDRTLSVLRKIFKKVTIVTSITGRKKILKFIDVPLIVDIYPDKGPLSAIYSALNHTTTEYAFICASDMPFLDEKLILSMLSKVTKEYNIITIGSEKIETLHTVYSKKLISVIKKMLDENDLAIGSLLKKERLILKEPVCVNHPSVFNINTRKDLERAEEIADES